MKTVSRVLALVLFVALAAPAHAQIMAMNGSWELNPGKSLGPSPVQETLVFTITPGLQAYTMTSVDGDGREGLNEWEIRYDGKDHPTRTPGATASVRRLDDKTEFVVNKREGNVTSTYTRVLVDDDQTLISIGRDGEGQVLWVRVFEKVAP
jgi:hypothetical protein